MAAHAGPPGFDETEDSWDAYQVRLQSYFEAYDIVDSKKRRALLTAALSTATVGIITVRCAPAKIQDLTYEKLLELLAEHFAPQGNEIAESYKFFTRCQRPDEATKDFIVEIRKKACSCNFGEARDRMLRDRLVCGLRDAGVRRKLLARPSLTLKEAEDIALAAEMAALNVDHMERTQDYGGVHARRMDGILQFIPGIQVYLDDVVVAEKRDHRPLLSLFSPDKPVPAMAAARIQRWSLLLSAYNYKIQFKPGKTLIPADTLSRLPVRQEHKNTKAAEDDARLDRDIEKLVNACPTCIEWGSMPPARQPVPWPDTEEPWSRVHVDFAGPVEGACNSGPPLSKYVWFKNYGVGDKWKPGAVESTEG
ncbi:uncharacterized protein [Dermacentor andersoni]|uniref:uncharacterized protein n=1 Tax=Dermacentor andersoni TaxID=34620 RepID=UPI003B3B1E15